MKLNLLTPVLDAKGVPMMDAQTPVPDGKGGVMFVDGKPKMQGGYSLLMSHIVTAALNARLEEDAKMNTDEKMKLGRLIIKVADDHPDLTHKEIAIIRERAEKTAHQLHFLRLCEYLDSVENGTAPNAAVVQPGAAE